MEDSTEPDGAIVVDIPTDLGTIACRYRDAHIGDSAVLWVFGAGGGWGGPAGGIYPRLGQQLISDGVSSLEVAYRRPGVLEPCMQDVSLALDWLQQQHRRRVALVGHSFGGAVVINMAAQSDQVIAVAALSPQSYGAFGISKLRGRPLLLVHGESDEILPDRCSRDLYRAASEPKELILYPNCRHGLDACVDELDRDLLRWLRGVFLSHSR